MVENFVHLHVHDTGSFLDGMCKIPDLISRAKELGMTAIAETNHNHIGLCYEFQKQCEMQGIKPILGGELYWTWDTNVASLEIEERRKLAFDKIMSCESEEKRAEIEAIIEKKGMSDKTIRDILKNDKKLQKYEYDMKQYHILFLAMNQTGWKNLVKLQSEASLKCTYNGRFLCDTEMIKKYNEGLIMTLACIGSAPADLIIKGKVDEAEALVKEWRDIFGDRLYLEIQPLNIEKQRKVNHQYYKWSQELNIKTVATNDVHYILKEDHDDHDTLLCIGTGEFKATMERMRYSNDFWLKTLDEMIEGFEEQANSMIEKEYLDEENRENYIEYCKNALAETNIVADRIEEGIKIKSDTFLFPQINIPGGISPEDYLVMKSYHGLYDYYKKTPDIDLTQYEKQLTSELEVIIKKGFASYMLIVAEYIEWAGSQGIMVGPGRGSAAGSLVLFCLGITKMVDPIKYNLMFSRFLTMDRQGMPDIDVDVDYYGRDDVLRHLESYYGKENVCHIGTYTIMGVKSGLKDVGRVLAIDFNTMNAISKEIDIILDKPQPSFADFDELKDGDDNDKAAYKRFEKLESDYPEIFRLARKFEGTHRGFGVHASGILVMPCEVTDYFPIRLNTKDNSVVALFTGTELDECSAVKLDVLGLRNVSLINNVLKHINLTMEEFYKKADITDPAIYELVRNRETDGIFQLESDLFKATIKEMQPTEIHDVIALTALCRPGPLSAKMHLAYAHRKNGLEDIIYPIRGCEHFLKQTYGVLCYQEQLMMVSKTVAGFDDGQSDSLTRKICAKKKLDQMEMLRRCHFYGKKNCEGPEGWESDADAPWYDPKAKYGNEIPGALANGYTVEEMDSYWQSILGFASYAFNLSHASTYSYISVLELWLKKYYPVEYMAALLSIQDNDEKRKKYIDICRKMGIEIGCPNINISETIFTPSGNSILYSLNSIKNVGDKAVEEILKNRPFDSLEDLLDKIPKKVLNKRVVTRLIESGALDSFDKNRYALINKLFDLRKAKDERYDESTYSNDACDAFEIESLGTCITNVPFWETISEQEKIAEQGIVNKIRKHYDKKGKEMAFLEITIRKCTITAIVFSKTWSKLKDSIEPGTEYLFIGDKTDKGDLLVSKIIPVTTQEISNSFDIEFAITAFAS